MRFFLIPSLALTAALIACDRTGDEYLNQPNPDYPGILDLGEFEPIPLDDFKGSGGREELLHSPPIREEGRLLRVHLARSRGGEDSGDSWS